MRRFIRIGFGAGALVLFSSIALSQEVPLPPPPPPPAGAGDVLFVRGGAVGAGGSTVEFLSTEIGVSGKVVKGAPYAAEAVTETTQTLTDGNRISRKSSSSLFRDGEGRTRREVTLSAIGPWASSSNAPTKLIFIHDPVAGVSYTLNDKDKTARKVEGSGMVMSFSAAESMPATNVASVRGEKAMMHEKMVAGASVMATEPMAAIRVPAPDSKNTKTESLGKRNIEGVVAEGTRVTHTIPAGEIGNERPIDVVSERWYSPELQTLVMTRQSDPRAGETIYKLTNLRRGEPARQMFEVPSDYTVTSEPVPPMMRKLRSGGSK
jgi:hypothetical protein